MDLNKYLYNATKGQRGVSSYTIFNKEKKSSLTSGEQLAVLGEQIYEHQFVPELNLLHTFNLNDTQLERYNDNKRNARVIKWAVSNKAEVYKTTKQDNDYLIAVKENSVFDYVYNEVFVLSEYLNYCPYIFTLYNKKDQMHTTVSRGDEI